MANTGELGKLPESAALAEASEDSLADLFAKDPLKYSEQDIGKIVKELRAQRVRWQQAEQGKPAPGASKAPKAKPAPANLETGELDL